MEPGKCACWIARSADLQFWSDRKGGKAAMAMLEGRSKTNRPGLHRGIVISMESTGFRRSPSFDAGQSCLSIQSGTITRYIIRPDGDFIAQRGRS